MPDLTLKTRTALDLRAALVGTDKAAGVETLTPPMTPKGRYVVTKATIAVTTALKAYDGLQAKLIDQYCERDGEGRPVMLGPNSFKMRDIAGYNAENNVLLDEDVTLAGVRQITRAEVGECPITAQHERILIAAGLLEDAEPA